MRTSHVPFPVLSYSTLTTIQYYSIKKPLSKCMQTPKRCAAKSANSHPTFKYPDVAKPSSHRA